ncbi:MAG TPA: helix-turn-helix domain-containing protein [Chloroflexota bacterium]|nr:helix-turn-helix domain-containing protein [Chloroflexota bacterium]
MGTATLPTTTSAPLPGMPPDTVDGDGQAAGTLAVASAALRGGFVLLPRTLLHAPGLSRDAKLLYAVLLSYAWQRGSCFPGYARLQADLGCGINQVTKYLRELEASGLVTRHRRGLGKTTVYTLHDPPAAPKVEPVASDAAPPEPPRPLIHQIGESGLTKSVKAVSPVRRHKQDSGEQDPAGHHPAILGDPPPSAGPPATLAPTTAPPPDPTGAGDDDALGLLVSRGVTRRIAQELVQTHSSEAIAQQAAWQAYRSPAKSPAGALVRAIRDAWPPPPAWAEAREHEAVVARQAEEEAQRQEADEARRREWAAKPPEERIAGRLQFWLLGRRAKRHEPTEAEIAAKRAELLAELAGASAPPPPPASPVPERAEASR